MLPYLVRFIKAQVFVQTFWVILFSIHLHAFDVMKLFWLLLEKEKPWLDKFLINLIISKTIWKINMSASVYTKVDIFFS